MKNIKPYIIFDKTIKSIKIKNYLNKKLNLYRLKDSNLILVIGGDGFMLQTLKKHKKTNKFFYGINSGNYGFLMNKFSPKSMMKNLHKAKMLMLKLSTLIQKMAILISSLQVQHTMQE